MMNRQAPKLTGQPKWDSQLGEFRLEASGAFGRQVVYLSADELQSVVQQAYDKHRVVAQLWTAKDPGDEWDMSPRTKPTYDELKQDLRAKYGTR